MSSSFSKLYCEKPFIDDEGVPQLQKYLSDHNFLKGQFKNWEAKQVQRIISLEYECGMLGEKWENIKEYEKSLVSTKKEMIANKHNNTYCFITVNPKNTILLSTFIKSIEKSVHRNIFTDYRYVYEQRGNSESEVGKGFHCHMLVKRNLDYKPSKVSSLLQNTFKDIVGDSKNNSLLNIQHIGSDFAKDKDEYMNGVKTGEGKDKKQQMDIIWRLKEKLESVYGKELF